MSRLPTPPFPRAIVTGASGFMGTALVRRLAEQSVRVVALDVQPPRETLSAGVEFMQVDLLDAEVLDRVLAQTSLSDAPNCRVFHLAAESHVGRCRQDPRRAHAINVGMTLHVLEACRIAGIRHLVFPSTALLYRKPRLSLVDESHPVAADSVYAATKLAAETMVAGFAEEFGFCCGIGRLGNVYGPGCHEDSIVGILLRQVQSGGPLVMRNLVPVRDFIYRDDVCSGLIAMAAFDATGPQVVNLASGIGTSIRDLALTLCRAAHLPEAIRQTDATAPATEDRLVLSIARAGELYGWRPVYSLEAGLRASLKEC